QLFRAAGSSRAGRKGSQLLVKPQEPQRRAQTPAPSAARSAPLLPSKNRRAAGFGRCLPPAGRAGPGGMVGSMTTDCRAERSEAALSHSLNRLIPNSATSPVAKQRSDRAASLPSA
nr:hypothetical protein [Tanacetum cinerariifolium]